VGKALSITALVPLSGKSPKGEKVEDICIKFEVFIDYPFEFPLLWRGVGVRPPYLKSTNSIPG
jgi:hypothetical protein